MGKRGRIELWESKRGEVGREIGGGIERSATDEGGRSYNPFYWIGFHT